VTDAAYLVIRLSFLVLLWLFVLAAVRAVRSDLFGPSKRQLRRDAPAPVYAPPPPPKAKRGKPSKLLVVAGSARGLTIPLGQGPITMGRAGDSSLVLDDDFASAHHARLVPQDGQWFVEDLGSTNGTYLDRTKVVRPTPVPVGVPVRIGKTVLELRR
jgi:pSer/pThr/pTyr-binding forkhead associated (FHA) protein